MTNMKAAIKIQILDMKIKFYKLFLKILNSLERILLKFGCGDDTGRP